MDNKDEGMLLGCILGAIGICFFILILSWLATCGLVYLATLCLGYEFSWLLATSIWIALILLKSIITNGKEKGE